MHYTGKGVAFFNVIFFLVLSIMSPLTQADSAPSSIQSLGWLPLLTANIKKLQPDINCPQNTINDINVDNTGAVISSQITEVSWDLDCFSDQVDDKKVNSTVYSKTEKDDQLILLLEQFAELPDFKLQLSTINLLSSFINIPFSTSLSFQKVLSKIDVQAHSDLLDAQLTIDLKNKQLRLKATVNLAQLPYYIQSTDMQRRYLNSELALGYQSSLKEWRKGDFNLDWKGEVPEISEKVSLSVKGDVNFLTSNITIKRFYFNAQQVDIAIAENQSWKSASIKIKNSAPLRINYSSRQIDALPLVLRIGTSNLLTRVERGKSKRIRTDKQKLPPLVMQLDAKGNKEQLLVDWAISLLNQTLSGHINMLQDIVHLEIVDNKINLQKLFVAGGNYVDELASIELESGEVTLDLSTRYHRNDARVDIESTITTDEIAGKKESILFDGLKINSTIHYYVEANQKITIVKDAQQVDIKNLFIGVPIQTLSVNTQINAGKPVIKYFKASLLGGRLDFDDLKLSAPSQTILHLSGISLPEIIKYSAYPEIETQAILDGMLPLMLTADGVEVTDGLISARPPGGYIRVPENTVIKAMGRGNPAFSFTMQLLSNFQFDTMQGRIGYTDDGESDIKVEINGLSPAVSGTQPINFNYSHNENILKLLQSLRFNEQLVRDIEERY